MELPHMGTHCSDSFCKQLDYLPMKCDACKELFCKDHLPYDDHSCKSLYKKNVQVPVCPLCNSPVPVPRGTVPDLAVSAHIEENCQSKKKEKVFTNKCNKPKCKKKELVPCICDSCHLNFCLTHRHRLDHDCKGPQPNSRPASKAAAAASARASTSNSSSSSSGQSKISNFFSGPFRTEHPRQPSAAAAAAINRQSGRGSTQGRPLLAPSNPNAGMSEDEALAAALAASMADSSQQNSGSASRTNLTPEEEEDRMLAQALQESERLARQQGQGQAAGSGDKNCNLQ